MVRKCIAAALSRTLLISFRFHITARLSSIVNQEWEKNRRTKSLRTDIVHAPARPACVDGRRTLTICALGEKSLNKYYFYDNETFVINTCVHLGSIPRVSIRRWRWWSCEPLLRGYFPLLFGKYHFMYTYIWTTIAWSVHNGVALILIWSFIYVSLRQ